MYLLSVLSLLADSLLILLVCYLLCFSFWVLAACDISCAGYRGVCLERLSAFRRAQLGCTVEIWLKRRLSACCWEWMML